MQVRQPDFVIKPASAGFRGVSVFRTDAVTPALPIREWEKQNDPRAELWGRFVAELEQLLLSLKYRVCHDEVTKSFDSCTGATFVFLCFGSNEAAHELSHIAVAFDVVGEQ